MKQLSLALNILLLVLVAVLFYLHFNSVKKMANLPIRATTLVTSSSEAPFRIGYFQMDSLQENYSYFKDAMAHLKEREQSMNTELAGMERDYQRKVGEWQKKGPSMSQTEADAAQRENVQLQQRYQTRKQTLEESITKQSLDFKKDIKKKIEVFLENYNENKKFAYILSYEPDFIFYKDTTCDITHDLVNALNADYKKNK